MGKSIPTPAAPAPPPEVPKEETLTEEERRSKANEERRQKAMLGRQEAILTSPLGEQGETKTRPRGIMGM